jgi:hypothetical protein
MDQHFAAIGQADHLPVPRSPVFGTFQIEQDAAGIIEVEIGYALAANEVGRSSQIVAGARLPFRHGL